MPGAEEVALFDRMGTLIPRRGHALRSGDFRYRAHRPHPAPRAHARAHGGVDSRAHPVAAAPCSASRATTRTTRSWCRCRDRFERLQAMRARLVGGRTTAFVLVLIPERLPIEETARALTQLDDTGVKIGGLVVNRVLPDHLGRRVPAVAPCRRSRSTSTRSPRGSPTVRAFTLPQFPKDVYGLASLGRVADALAARHRSARMTIAKPAARRLRAVLPEVSRCRRGRSTTPPDLLARQTRRACVHGDLARRQGRPSLRRGQMDGGAGHRTHGRHRAHLRPIACCASRAATRRRWPASTRTRISCRAGFESRPLASVVAELRAVRQRHAAAGALARRRRARPRRHSPTTTARRPARWPGSRRGTSSTTPMSWRSVTACRSRAGRQGPGKTGNRNVAQRPVHSARTAAQGISE